MFSKWFSLFDWRLPLHERIFRFWNYFKDPLAIMAIYMVPCVLGLIFVGWVHYNRSWEAADQLTDRGLQLAKSYPNDAAPQAPSSSISPEIDESFFTLPSFPIDSPSKSDLCLDPGRLARVDEAWESIFSSPKFQNGEGELLSGVDLEKLVRSTVESGVREAIWIRQLPVIAFFTLVPFFLYAGRIGLSQSVHLRARVITEIGAGPRASLYETALHGFWIRFLLACMIALSFAYYTCPSGRAASTVEEFTRFHLAMQTSTYAEFLRPHNSEMAPLLAGMLGWYIHMLTTFYFRSARLDVLGKGIFTLMVQRCLIVLGVAMVIRLAYGETGADSMQRVVLPFMVGMVPTSAWSILVDLSTKTFQGTASTAPLAVLASIPRDKIVRLNEEGIDDVVDLAATDPVHVSALTNIPQAALEDWIDRAQLAEVVGSEAYEKLRSICGRASSFRQRYSDPAFVAAVIEAGIKNPSEVYTILLTRFGSGELPTPSPAFESLPETPTPSEPDPKSELPPNSDPPPQAPTNSP